MSRAKNWNAPENWLGWLRNAKKDPGCPIEARGSLGMITGTDAKVLGAIAALWHVGDGQEVRAVVRALLPLMQKECWPFARELIAQQWDWNDRDRLWPLVSPEFDGDLITVTVKELTPSAMAGALDRLALDFKMLAKAERAVEGLAQ